MSQSILYNIFYLVYIIILIFVCLKIIIDSKDTSKSLAYILFAIFVPIVGIIFYFSFGVNYRKSRIYSKKLHHDDELEAIYNEEVSDYFVSSAINNSKLEKNADLAQLLFNSSVGGISSNNQVQILVNGEEKFPKVIEAIKNAKNHIHIEYFIFEDDNIGNYIANLLIEKVKEGVEVRFIYDDYGSRHIRKTLVRKLKDNGVKVFPFYKIKIILLANRLNYRNHRKIIVIDGKIGFMGGINIADRYINSDDFIPKDNNLERKKVEKKKYWRDTHIFIEGPGVYSLQYVFLCDWNFCAKDNLVAAKEFFPFVSQEEKENDKTIQIVASGPDSEYPMIEFSILKAINNSKKELLITTPYFIPSNSVLDAIFMVSLSGVKVKLLVPENSDTHIVDYAAMSYFDYLLKAGVEIYLYKKGIIHSKTLVSDRNVSIVGSANMDIRSFDLNFEINTMIYDKKFAQELVDLFNEDLKYASRITKDMINEIPFYVRIWSNILKLFSPLL